MLTQGDSTKFEARCISENRFLKAGYAIFQKRFRKLTRAEYQNKLVANQQ